MRPYVPLLLSACAGEPLVLDVDHYQVACLGETWYLCPLTRADADDAWAKQFEPIRGWEFRWGHRARLEVTRAETTNARGQTVLSYRLRDILDEDLVEPGTSFLFAWEPGRNADSPLVASNAQGGAFTDGQPFTCADPDVCQRLSDARDTFATVVLDLRWDDPATGDLVLQGLSVQ